MFTAKVVSVVADPDIAALSIVTAFLEAQLVSIEEGQWNGATPCGDWDLRALVDHVTGGNWFTLAVLSRVTADDALTRAREQFANGSPTARLAALSASEQHEAFLAPGVLDGTWHHVAGDLTGRTMLRLRLHDLIVHAWDINQSLGSVAGLPEELALWGLAEITSDGSLAARHFEIDARRLSDRDHSVAGYLRLFDRDGAVGG